MNQTTIIVRRVG